MGKRGPKAKGGYGDKTKVFSSRLNAETRNALQEAAKKSGRSLSSEVEHRLRRSFDNDRVVEVLGGRQMFAILRAIAAAMNASGIQILIGRDSAPDSEIDAAGVVDSVNWLNDPYAFDCAVRAANVVLEALRPPGAPTPWSMTGVQINAKTEEEREEIRGVLQWVMENRGEMLGETVLRCIARSENTQPAPGDLPRSDNPLLRPRSGDPLFRRIASDLGELHDRAKSNYDAKARRRKNDK